MRPLVWHVAAVIAAVILTSVESRAFKVPIHAEITRQALAEVSQRLLPSVRAFQQALGITEPVAGFSSIAVLEIENANKSRDTGDCWLEDSLTVPAEPCTTFTFESPAAAEYLASAPDFEHFDDESLQAANSIIVKARAAVRQHLLARRYVAARKVLGGTLHTLQDFYAHTNWVELGQSGIEKRIGTERGFDVGQPEVATKSERTCEDGVRLVTKKLTSGYFFLTRDTPEIVDLGKCRHGWRYGYEQPGMNKDEPDSGDLTRTGAHLKARELARQHTVEFVMGIVNDQTLQSDWFVLPADPTYPAFVLGLLGYEVVADGRGTLVAPGNKRQSYTPKALDLSNYTSGTLVIQVRLGSGESAGSFDLYPENVKLPTIGDPIGAVSSAWDITPGASATLKYEITRAGKYTFGATGNWFSRQGSTNTFTFVAYVIGGQPPSPNPLALSRPKPSPRSPQ